MLRRREKRSSYNIRMELSITIPQSQVADLCRRYHVRRLAVFGSVLRGQDDAGSDLDLLVEFEPGAIIGLKFISLQEELSDLFERTVDLNTPAFISRHFRDQVMEQAQVIYERN